MVYYETLVLLIILTSVTLAYNLVKTECFSTWSERDYVWLILKFWGPVCGCPYDKSPAIWGLCWGPFFGNSHILPTRGISRTLVLHQLPFKTRPRYII